MKIAIGSNGKTIEDEVSSICGRASNFLIFENKKLIEVIYNPFRTGGGGAGAGVAKMLLDKGVKMIICGKLGPNMTMWLDDKGANYKEISGKKIKEVLEELD